MYNKCPWDAKNSFQSHACCYLYGTDPPWRKILFPVSEGEPPLLEKFLRCREVYYQRSRFVSTQGSIYLGNVRSSAQCGIHRVRSTRTTAKQNTHMLKSHRTNYLSLVRYRLAWPKRLKDCMHVFDKERGWLSSVFNGTYQHIYQCFRDKLLWDKELLSLQALDRYCTVIQRQGEPSGRVWGFIDGTHRPIRRSRLETAPKEELYSAYKKFHSMEYLVIVTPNRLLACLRGLYEGRASDWGIPSFVALGAPTPGDPQRPLK
jgi:hypothetical protein